MEENISAQQVNPEPEKTFKSYLKPILIILIPLILIGAAILPWYILTGGKQFDPSLLMFWQKAKPAFSPAPTQQPLAWKPASQLIKEGKIEPFQKVLDIGLSYNSKNSKVLLINSLKIRKGYQPRVSKRTEGSYQLQILDENKRVLEKKNFAVPNEVLVQGKSQAEEETQQKIVVDKINFIISFPFLTEASSVTLLDSTGALIASKSLKEAENIDSEPDYDVLMPRQSTKDTTTRKGFLMPWLNEGLIKKAFAQEQPAKLRIGFIGQDYKNKADYDKDMQFLIKQLESSEVYKLSPEKFEIQVKPFDPKYTNTYLGCWKTNNFSDNPDFFRSVPNGTFYTQCSNEESFRQEFPTSDVVVVSEWGGFNTLCSASQKLGEINLQLICSGEQNGTAYLPGSQERGPDLYLDKIFSWGKERGVLRPSEVVNYLKLEMVFRCEAGYRLEQRFVPEINLISSEGLPVIKTPVTDYVNSTRTDKEYYYAEFAVFPKGSYDVTVSIPGYPSPVPSQKKVVVYNTLGEMVEKHLYRDELIFNFPQCPRASQRGTSVPQQPQQPAVPAVQQAQPEAQPSAASAPGELSASNLNRNVVVCSRSLNSPFSGPREYTDRDLPMNLLSIFQALTRLGYDDPATEANLINAWNSLISCPSNNNFVLDIGFARSGPRNIDSYLTSDNFHICLASPESDYAYKIRNKPIDEIAEELKLTDFGSTSKYLKDYNTNKYHALVLVNEYQKRACTAPQPQSPVRPAAPTAQTPPRQPAIVPVPARASVLPVPQVPRPAQDDRCGRVTVKIDGVSGLSKIVRADVTPKQVEVVVTCQNGRNFRYIITVKSKPPVAPPPPPVAPANVQPSYRVEARDLGNGCAQNYRVYDNGTDARDGEQYDINTGGPCGQSQPQPEEAQPEEAQPQPEQEQPASECSEAQEECRGDQSWFCVGGRWTFDVEETNRGDCRPRWRCEDGGYRKYDPPSDSSDNVIWTDDFKSCDNGCSVIQTDGYREDAQCN